MAVTIQIRRDQASDWTAANPILAEGEMGLELDTGLRKIGDGVTVWTSLAYYDNQASFPATDITYDNTTSGLTATDVQAALDEIDAQVDTNTAAIALPPEQFAARKNLLINGGFDVWQRGTSISTVGSEYTADRWATQSTATVDRVSGPTGFPYAGQGLSSGVFQFRQAIELPAAGEAGVFQVGQSLTLSLWANAPIGEELTLVTFFADDSALTNLQADLPTTVYGVGTGDWAKYSLTWQVTGAPIGSSACYVVALRHLGNITAAYSGVQLELGDTATDFEYRHIGEELALCQRYYQKSYRSSVYAGAVAPDGAIAGTAASTTRIGGFSYRVLMQGNPTVAIYGTDGGAGQVTPLVGGATVGSGFVALGLVDSGVYAINGTGVVAGTVYRYQYTADAEL